MTTRLGRYAIESELGRGGMGVIYRARDERLGKPVALKMLLEPESRSAEDRARLRQEARSAAILSHPSIVAVFDYDEESGGAPFIVYEYVEGQTLDKLLVDGPLGEERIIDIGSQVAAGLAYAHERGILHRDIKPQNLIISPDGRARILDFGLAKRTGLELLGTDGRAGNHSSVATTAGTIVGTVQYMSPEQVAGEPLDGRSDTFSLGIVLCELATGKNPFLGTSLASTVGKIVSAEPPLAELEESRVSKGLQAIILKALQKNRLARYQSATQLREDLERLKSGSSPSHAGSGAKPDVRRGSGIIPRKMARISIVLLQILYLSIYSLALIKHMEIVLRIAFLSGDFIGYLQVARHITTSLLITGCCGIPVRLYLLASAAFDDPDTGSQFGRLFPFLFLLDEIWALTPLVLVGKWPAGLTLLCVAVMAYLPFSHRNLMRSAYSSRP